MKAKLNGKEVNVIKLSGPEVYGVADELLCGFATEDSELPAKGTVYLFQSCEDQETLKSNYLLMVDLARERGDEYIPSLDDIVGLDGLVRFKAQYYVWHPAPGETGITFLKVESLERAYEIDEDGNLVKVETVEEMRVHWRDFILPIPPPSKSAADELYLTLAYEFYDAIKAGTKKTEYRDYTQNWVKKILSHPIRTVKFQRGYGGPGRPKPEQMVWTVKKVWLYESDTDQKGDPLNPPEGILPDCIAIDLGRRVS